jgi:DNA uptake protein ComE-like DNA-binding protein
MKISGISQTKAEEIVKLRAKENFKKYERLTGASERRVRKPSKHSH